MATEINAEKRVQCPSCGQKSKQVSPATLRALLREEYASQFDDADHPSCASNDGDETGCKPSSGNTGWRFCDSQGCAVVYFSEEGDTSFTKSQLRVEVGVKEKSGERPLCYCFGHSVASIKDDLQVNGRSDALEDVRNKMTALDCRCEIENPSGSCCLGSVGKGIQIAQVELGMDNTEIQATTPSKSTTEKGEKIAKIGTIVSAIMASSCCWLPLLLLAVGVSGAGIASTLEAYRPLFMVVTFGFLGAAFYFTYRPPKAVGGAEHGCCVTVPSEGEECCSPTTKGRFNMMTLNKAMLWGVTVMAIAFLFFPSYVGAIIGGDGMAVTENMNRAVITVEGMTCEGCSALVAKAIRTAPGVLAVEVDYETGEVIIGTEIDCPVPEKKILIALEEAGYKGTFSETREGAVRNVSRSSIDSNDPVQENNKATRISVSEEPLSQTIFQIEGMTCEGCAAGVSEVIGDVIGVTDVTVEFTSGRAIVRSPACCTLPTDAVLSAIEQAGFGGSLIDGEKASQPAR